MPSLLTRLLLFLSAYAPVLLILAIQLYSAHPRRAIALVAIGAVACLSLFGFVRWVRNSEPRPATILSVQRKDGEIIAYLFSYVFPFLSINFQETASVLGLSVFFATLMIINISSSMIHINPVLSLLGYHLYEVTFEDGSIQTLLTRRKRLLPGTRIQAVTLADSVLMEA